MKIAGACNGSRHASNKGISFNLRFNVNLMADHWIQRNVAQQPFGNPLKYAASASRSRSDLPIFCSISQSDVPILRVSSTMVVGNHILAWLQIACKTISGKCESVGVTVIVADREGDASEHRTPIAIDWFSVVSKGN